VRDHRKILGTLFIAWAVLQVIASIVLVASGDMAEVPLPWLYWISTALLAIAYGWVGLKMRQHDPRVRFLAILLSVLALISFPFGTALGVYGLVILLRGQRQVPAESRSRP